VALAGGSGDIYIYICVYMWLILTVIVDKWVVPMFLRLSSRRFGAERAEESLFLHTSGQCLAALGFESRLKATTKYNKLAVRQSLGLFSLELAQARN
jgi:hypothetical protein